ncbi:MAG: hypothetical protein A3K23_01370 [Desulfobacca sp. RBG_16_58_9]|nr:MAG: hypothetical protein A3K23_01370 [Desulfobacca sp. RBG_16_58_9]
METGCSLAIGEEVEFGLSLPAEAPEEKGAYRFSGQVVWIRESEPEPKRYCIGLSFLTPFRETNKILAEFRYRLISEEI